MKRLFILLVLLSSAFAYTNGSGTIQDCQTNAYDYCTINVSSVIQNGDFVLNNRETIIESGTAITLRSTRLFINSSEKIWIKENAWLNGDGRTALTDPDGGSGGSFLIQYEGQGAYKLDGVTSGNHGIGLKRPNPGPCANPDAGEGSNNLPFDFSPGAAGIGDTVSPYGATGGGFYATGGVYNRPLVISACHVSASGGSGHAIKLQAAKIQIDGTLSSRGGAGSVGTWWEAAAAGSGGGEITLYSATTNITGAVLLSGGNGAIRSYVNSIYADGGAGGRFRSCALLNNYTTALSLSGGTCAYYGTTCTNGASGTATYVSNSSCYQSMVLNLYTLNNTNITESNPIYFNLGVFDNLNVTCRYELNSTSYELGQYNLTSEVITYSFLPSTNGTYNVNVTCGNEESALCYQETANVSTACGGLDTGTYAFAGSWTDGNNLIDGDWDTFGSGDVFGANLYINYTIPSSANRATSYWQIKRDTLLGAKTANVSIPAECWNLTTNTISFRVFSQTIGDITSYCSPDGGTTWTSIDIQTSVSGFYEESMWWNISSGGISDVTTNTILVNVDSTITPPAPPPAPPSGGGGSGTSGGAPSSSDSSFTAPETVDEQLPLEEEQPEETFYPDPNQNPDFYLNPASTTNQGSIADSIVEASGGEIQQLPYQCTPFFASAFNFVGSQFADSFICEYKGLQSLYVKKFSFFINGALITLMLMAIMTVNQKKTSNYNLFLALTVITAVIGFDFFAFMATALLLLMAGKPLGV